MGMGRRRLLGRFMGRGCRVFFTTNAVEGARIRPFVADAVIGYFDGLFVEDVELIRGANLTPSINDEAQIAVLETLRGDDNAPPAVMVQVDTAMNRFGLDWRWLTETRASALQTQADIKLLYSHLASCR